MHTHDGAAGSAGTGLTQPPRSAQIVLTDPSRISFLSPFALSMSTGLSGN